MFQASLLGWAQIDAHSAGGRTNDPRHGIRLLNGPS